MTDDLDSMTPEEMGATPEDSGQCSLTGESLPDPNKLEQTSREILDNTIITCEKCRKMYKYKNRGKHKCSTMLDGGMQVLDDDGNVVQETPPSVCKPIRDDSSNTKHPVCRWAIHPVIENDKVVGHEVLLRLGVYKQYIPVTYEQASKIKAMCMAVHGAQCAAELAKNPAVSSSEEELLAAAKNYEATVERATYDAEHKLMPPIEDEEPEQEESGE